ncbi:MAG: hypothetical protein C4539_04005 [Ignavibacteriales bacterium]|nr:MAG: hypothetical protein C4539_04005 [Ignavibacteriales bacterium]
MKKQNQINKGKYLLKTIFVFSILFSLVRIDNLVYSSIDLQKHQPLSTTELVVQKIKTTAAGIYKIFSSPIAPVKHYDSQAESIHFNRYALLYYNNYKLIQYKTLEANSVSAAYHIKVIHKNNISHLSQDDDSLC